MPNAGAAIKTTSDAVPPKKWKEAQERVLLDEFRKANAHAPKSMEQVEKWFAALPLAERDRIGRRLNDPSIIGRYLQTPRTH